MNTDRINRDDYIFRVIPVTKEQNKKSCFRRLTLTNRHILLCHNTYDEKYINSVIESSNYFLYYTTKQNIGEILCFALVKITSKHVCDILLLCAIPNELQYGNMMAYAVHGFAINKKCTKIYTAPRTELLRKTFIKYGFEHLRGVKNYDEVLIKQIILPPTFVRSPHILNVRCRRPCGLFKYNYRQDFTFGRVCLTPIYNPHGSKKLFTMRKKKLANKNTQLLSIQNNNNSQEFNGMD